MIFYHWATKYNPDRNLYSDITRIGNNPDLDTLTDCYKSLLRKGLISENDYSKSINTVLHIIISGIKTVNDGDTFKSPWGPKYRLYNKKLEEV